MPNTEYKYRKVNQLGKETPKRIPSPKLGTKKVKAITPSKTSCS